MSTRTPTVRRRRGRRRGSGRAHVAVHPTFPALDSLRFVGALAVLTTHVAFQTGEYLRNGVWGLFLARLDLGVAIFFVLSGFLLSRPWLARAANAMPPPGVARYAEKRFVRIMPAYVVTAVLALTLMPDNEDRGLAGWFSTLLLLDPYTQKALPHGLTHMWSLSAEVLFYALLPLLMLIALGRGRALAPRRVCLVLLTMATMSVVWLLFVERALDQHVAGAAALWLPGYLTWFAAGIWLAMVDVRHSEDASGRRHAGVVAVARMPGACWTLAAGLVLVSCTPLAGPVLFQAGTPGESLTKHLLYTAIGTLVVMTGVWAEPTGRFARVMSARLPRHLGHISYSIFCVHLMLISLVLTVTDYQLFAGDFLAVWALTLGATLVASELLYRLVEMPATRLPRRWRGGDVAATHATTPDTASTTRS